MKKSFCFFLTSSRKYRCMGAVHRLLRINANTFIGAIMSCKKISLRCGELPPLLDYLSMFISGGQRGGRI